MLKKLMISAAVSALMVSGALAQAHRLRVHLRKRTPPDQPEVRVVAEGRPVGVFEVQGHRRLRPGQRAGRRRDDCCSTRPARSIGRDRRRRRLPRHRREERRDRHERVPGRAVPAPAARARSAPQAPTTDPNERQAEGVLDQGPAQERAGLPVLQAGGTGTHERQARRPVADNGHGAAARGTGASVT